MTDKLSEMDLELVKQLRDDVKDVIPGHYDTDFNLFRWIKFYGRDINVAGTLFRKHLKLRQITNFDSEECNEMINSEIYQNYIPIGIVGPAGKGNKILAFDLIGRTDTEAVTQAFQSTPFIIHRCKFMDKLQKMMMEQEKLTNEQSGLIYVYDLEGLSMNPFLLPIVTGPMKIFLYHVYGNFPDMMHKIILINVPTFMNVIWAAFSPFVPEHITEKIIFTGSNWKDVLLEYVDAECLPVHWGGKMVDSNGDPMCRDRIVIPPGKIPKELYWKPKAGNPTMDDLTPINVPAGEKACIGYYVKESDTFLEWFIYCCDEFTFAMYYSEDTENRELSEMEKVFDKNQFPGIPTIDDFKFHCKKAGNYYLEFGNENAWFLSVTPQYAIRFWDKQGNKIEPILIEEEPDMH